MKEDREDHHAVAAALRDQAEDREVHREAAVVVHEVAVVPGVHVVVVEEEASRNLLNTTISEECQVMANARILG